ncbi:MAG: YkgJ family cysteine cluster protein [Desulfobacteraceae bacterium]|nr:MAG: YkgJ family cysteine cluster protein [Desulfobacteraceae bacterium]
MKAFECKQCGECCRGEGGIRVQGEEIGKIARFLSITDSEFISTWCFLRHDRYYINTGTDGFCAFFEREKQCTIHPVKPLPCRLWPFYSALLADADNWDLAKGACPGINRDSSFEEFLKQSRE